MIDSLILRLGESAKAPVVVLVMGGGYSTLKSGLAAIEENIPLLVFAGSGGAADVIAAAYDKPLVLLQTFPPHGRVRCSEQTYVFPFASWRHVSKTNFFLITIKSGGCGWWTGGWGRACGSHYRGPWMPTGSKGRRPCSMEGATGMILYRDQLKLIQ